jgi:pyridoxine/pyridoxamine 5'-phosphate oxidase
MQVRCKTLPNEHISESWQLRPDTPKRMDWLYQQHAQGSEVSSRETLLQMLQDLSAPEPLTAPVGAKGLLLVPETVERLDLTQANGVHDRVRYRLQASGWEQHTLIP